MASALTHIGLLAVVPLVLAPTGASAAAPAAPGLAACAAPAAAHLQPAAHAAAARPVAQLRHVPEADLLFSGRLGEDGGFTTEARGGELVFQKKSLPGGGFVLDLAAPKDSVAIQLTAAGITVTRNQRQATVSLNAGSDDELDAVRRLLLGSAAVRLTRRAAEALQVADDESIAGTSLHVADALIGLLTGDEAAPGRTARHLARRGRGQARRIQNFDCYTLWESQVLKASYEFQYCYLGFPQWNPIRNTCSFRWLLQIESYWFSLISCTGFSQF